MRLILSDRGNGHRPSSPNYKPSNPTVPGEAHQVVVLDVSGETHEQVGHAHHKALAALEDGDASLLLTGAIVQIDNPAPVDSDEPGPVTVYVGGSTLFEAATEVIGCYENLARHMPQWVASTNDELAAVVAEHFTVKGYSACKVLKLEEVVA